jgi:hypothetical protein
MSRKKLGTLRSMRQLLIRIGRNGTKLIVGKNRKKKTIIFFKYQLVIIRNRCSIFKPVFVHLEILLPKNLMFMVSLIWKIYSLNRKSDRVVTIGKRRTLCNYVQ